jgi:hypothetical protein
MDDKFNAPAPAPQQNNIFEDTMKTIQNTASKVKDGVSEVVKTTASTADFYTSKMTIVAGLLFVILLSIFVSYGLYYVISASIFNQSRIVVEGTKVPVVCNVYNKFEITSFNKSGNGKRRTYTFWIYINDMNTYNGSYKHVWHIGSSSSSIKSASPFVFLDAYQNRMYFRFAALSGDNFVDASSVQNLTPTQLSTFMQQGIEIPYIPMQRWVHIAVVVNENANGGTIVAYVDGDISKIVSTGELINGNSIKVSNLDLDKMGDLHVGGTFEGNIGPGFSGLISKVSLFNYDLNDKDIYNDYNKGPLSGFLSSLGLASYGLRNPIYKIV